jgi:gamma-glutamyl:cysteine ligase YbdK (ATP-grasp superfamily)
MGDAQKLSPDEQIRTAFEAYESGKDFTVAVEEEFAILDPETLELSNRFEELQAAAKGGPLEQHLVGELIASEVEVRTGRCETFAEAGERMVERRSQLHELASSLGATLAGTGTHPWSRWQDQRIIDTPHYRRNNELLQYVVWRNNTFGLHVHVGIRGADRAVAVCNLLRNYLPELLALSASSPFVEGVNSGHARRFSRARSRAAESPTHMTVGRASSATSVSSTTRARSTSTRSCGGVCARTSPSRQWRSESAMRSPISSRRSRSRR